MDTPPPSPLPLAQTGTGAGDTEAGDAKPASGGPPPNFYVMFRVWRKGLRLHPNRLPFPSPSGVSHFYGFPEQEVLEDTFFPRFKTMMFGFPVYDDDTALNAFNFARLLERNDDVAERVAEFLMLDIIGEIGHLEQWRHLFEIGEIDVWTASEPQIRPRGTVHLCPSSHLFLVPQSN